MKILIAGICGFTGSTLARTFQEFDSSVEVSGIDNFLRAGSELNRSQLKTTGVRVLHGDVRCPSDFDLLPKVDWVVDAAANPSVLAGVTEDSSSRQLLEHNLVGTINLLEYCKRTGAGLVIARYKPGLLDRAARQASCAHRKRCLSPKFRFLCRCRFVRPRRVGEIPDDGAGLALWSHETRLGGACPRIRRGVSVYRYGSIVAGSWQVQANSASPTREFLRFGSILIYDGDHSGTLASTAAAFRYGIASTRVTWRRLPGSKCNRPFDQLSECKTWAVALLRPCHWLS